jgi:rod shape-determining protein MreC
LNSATTSRNLPKRGYPARPRFFVYAVLALALMWADQRSGWLEALRYGLQAIAYPLQIALNSPAAAWRWTRDTLESREALQVENRQLREQIRALQRDALRRADLERENNELRALRAAAGDVAEKWLPGRLIGEEANRLRHRLIIDRGARHGVSTKQTVIAGSGLIGQTLRVGPWSSEVITLADPEHAVPVQISRTGVRTLAVGSGRPGVLILPFLPLQTDVRPGDRLLTSGLGGTFPAGYPVATVLSVSRDGASPLAQVEAVTAARLDRDRTVAFLWFRSQHPAAPAGTSLAGIAP